MPGSEPELVTNHVQTILLIRHSFLRLSNPRYPFVESYELTRNDSELASLLPESPITHVFDVPEDVMIFR